MQLLMQLPLQINLLSSILSKIRRLRTMPFPRRRIQLNKVKRDWLGTLKTNLSHLITNHSLKFKKLRSISNQWVIYSKAFLWVPFRLQVKVKGPNCWSMRTIKLTRAFLIRSRFCQATHLTIIIQNTTILTEQLTRILLHKSLSNWETEEAYRQVETLWKTPNVILKPSERSHLNWKEWIQKPRALSFSRAFSSFQGSWTSTATIQNHLFDMNHIKP